MLRIASVVPGASPAAGPVRTAAAGCALATAFGLVPASPAPGAAPALEIGWSRPTVVGRTDVDARPALVVDREGRAHVFFLDRDGADGVVRWAAVLPDGRTVLGPRTVAPADLRARALAAAREGDGIRLAWVARVGEGMRVAAARLRGDGTVALAPHPVGPPADDAGPVAAASSPRGAHLVWSQVSGKRREIWHWISEGGRTAPLGPGDAPALSVGPAGPIAVWWQRTGFEAYRLVAAPLSGAAVGTGTGIGAATHIPLTGSLATSSLEPPAAAHDAAGRLLVAFGTTLRGFGPPVARLSVLQLGSDGRPSPRRSLAPGSPFAMQVTAVPWQDRVALAWADLRSGRSRNPEIYFGLARGDAVQEQRLTYTLSASTRPALAVGPGDALTAAWLEVTPDGRFAVNLASTARPAPRRFLLGIPELDLHRPGDAAAFAATALVGALPYALMLALTTSLLTAAAVLIGRPVFEEARWWRWLAASGTRAAVATLALALGLQATAAGALFPFLPRLQPGPAAAVLAVCWLGLRARRGWAEAFGSRALAVLLVVFAVSAALVFGWAARALSPLLT